jgi:hypothetical protein
MSNIERDSYGMLSMQDYQTWRELLAELIKSPRERKRIARLAKIDGEVLIGWSENAGSPTNQQLYALLQAAPQRRVLLRTLIIEEFEDFEDDLLDSAPNTSIIAFSTRMLELYANTPDQSRTWSMCTAVLSEAVKRLDPEHLGISASVVECVPGREGVVSSLRESVGLGTPPWLEQIEVKTRFLGVESLAGAAVSSGLVQMVTNSNQAQRLATNLPEYTVSAAAFPIIHSDRIAGCFLLTSTQPDYFTSATRQELIENYKAMLALAFPPNNFYRREQIKLQAMPAFQAQQPYLSTVQDRIVATLKTAFSANRTISYLEAQQHVCGQIAEELVLLV